MEFGTLVICDAKDRYAKTPAGHQMACKYRAATSRVQKLRSPAADLVTFQLITDQSRVFVSLNVK